MVEIKGKISDLFKCPDTEINEVVDDNLLESVIDSPITKNGRIVGVVKHIDKDKNEWKGFLFNNVKAWVHSGKCFSVNLMDL